MQEEIKEAINFIDKQSIRPSASKGCHELEVSRKSAINSCHLTATAAQRYLKEEFAGPLVGGKSMMRTGVMD